MDGTMTVLVYQMKIIATLMAIGLLEQRLKLFDNDLIHSLATIIAKLILPLMLITIIGSLKRNELVKGFRVFFATLICYVVFIFIAKLISKFSKKEEPQKSMHLLLQCYGNSGYIGIPLITSIFSFQAGIAAAAFTIVDSFFYWVVAPSIVGKKNISIKKLISPMTLSIFLGIIIVLFNLDLNGNIVWDTMKNVGATCKYFASIYIGMSIGRLSLSSIKTNLASASAAVFKLILIPVCAFFLFGRTGFLQGDTLLMFIILLATPSGMSLPIVANIAGIENSEYISVGVTISTILCLITIPFVIWLINII